MPRARVGVRVREKEGRISYGTWLVHMKPAGRRTCVEGKCRSILFIEPCTYAAHRQEGVWAANDGVNATFQNWGFQAMGGKQPDNNWGSEVCLC